MKLKSRKITSKFLTWPRPWNLSKKCPYFKVLQRSSWSNNLIIYHYNNSWTFPQYDQSPLPLTINNQLEIAVPSKACLWWAMGQLTMTTTAKGCTGKYFGSRFTVNFWSRQRRQRRAVRMWGVRRWEELGEPMHETGVKPRGSCCWGRRGEWGYNRVLKSICLIYSGSWGSWGEMAGLLYGSGGYVSFWGVWQNFKRLRFGYGYSKGVVWPWSQG